jgi:hypothetical protein
MKNAQRLRRMVIRLVPLPALLLTAATPVAWSQPTEPTVLIVDTADTVEYIDDMGEPTKYGLVSEATTAVNPKGTPHIAIIGDIKAVNGQPVKGTIVASMMAFGGGPTVRPGFAITDISRTGMRTLVFEFLNLDGSQIGTIAALGFSAGPVPPGAPSAQNGANYAIVGGTGAFFGARGSGGSGNSGTGNPAARRGSSIEDPAYRRVLGGGTARFVLQLLPANSPKFVDTGSGPGVTHSADFTLVTPAQPASPGELLSLFVTGLGATTPGQDPGRAFSESPLSTVAAPIAVTIGGKQATVIGAVGYPGAIDGYQVNIRVPSDVPAGMQEVQLTSAWVKAPPVVIPMR